MSGLPFGLPWVGGGPWRIDDECFAARHNSLRHGRSRGGQVRCSCPRAAMLVDAENRRRRENFAGQQPRKKRGGREPMSRSGPQITGAWVPKGVTVPDLTGAMCRTPMGLAIVDKVLTANGGAGTAAVKEHKDLCSFCPVIEKCDVYIVAAEQPAGSWAGVWAGMSQGDRRARARQEGRK